MLACVLLILAAITAFALLGILLGIFRLGGAVRIGLMVVAHQFSFSDDDDEEEAPGPLDDVDYFLDDESDEEFFGIAKGLWDLERLGKKIVESESKE